MATTRPSAKKPFASSILLWMRIDQPRQQGMDHWKGPHSKIISATPGMEEYRQIHLAENNPGLWPAVFSLIPLLTLFLLFAVRLAEAMLKRPVERNVTP